MRLLFQLLFILGLGYSLTGQTEIVLEKGTVSYVSSRNIYVKFASTKKINLGDTLYIDQNGGLIAVVVVSNKSSTSTVCTPLVSEKIKVKDELLAKVILEKEQPKEVPKEQEEKREEVSNISEETNKDESISTLEKPNEEEVILKQKIKGRLSASSYSNLSDYKNSHRMRYAFSMQGNNIKNSKFSTDSYLTFRNTLGEWAEVRENFNQALKIYSLSVKYDFSPVASVTLGRKINPRISSMGAIDGLQFEKGLGQVRFGVIAGSRPDHVDYSINFSLLQLGVYTSYFSKDVKKNQSSTLGFIEQRNSSKIDRRFVYFQHTGELMKNLNLFGSFEVDLYENIHNEAKNLLSLTNLYLSLRYRLSKKLSFSTAYDSRKNIIYYESYKTFIDRLIENETRQGLRFGVNYRPLKFLSWGLNSSLRFQKSHTNGSKNLNTYISISRVPILNLRANLRANFLQTDYLNSQIYEIRLSRDIIKRRLTGDAYLRMVDYLYKSSDRTVHQNIYGVNFSLRLMKKLTLYLYYEGTFDDQGQAYHRINTKIIQRF